VPLPRAAPATRPAPESCATCRPVADKENNTIIIVATPVEFAVIESAAEEARRAGAGRC